jgi:hypothetical protein
MKNLTTAGDLSQRHERGNIPQAAAESDDQSTNSDVGVLAFVAITGEGDFA